jgi:hypothetical protein
MSYPVFEYTMARLLTDPKYLSDFQKDPNSLLEILDLSTDEKVALKNMDADQLAIAAKSFQKKKAETCVNHKSRLKKLFSIVNRPTRFWRFLTFHSNQ